MKELTSDNFKDIEEYAFVLVHSSTCEPCELALKYYPQKHKNVAIYKLDFLSEEELCDVFNIAETPTACFLHNGKVINTLWGLQEPITVDGFIYKIYEKLKRRKLSKV